MIYSMIFFFRFGKFIWVLKLARFKGALLSLRQFLAIEGLLIKWWKVKWFSLLWKLFSFSRYLNFWLDFLVKLKKTLTRKMMLTNIVNVTTWLTIIIYILSNISRNKGNQALTFGYLKEKHEKHFPWNMREMWRWYYSQTLF